MDKTVILVIEDEPTINRIISSYFVKENYEVISALDGEEGLKLFEENKVDLVCLDIMMPRINGWEVAKRIRETSDIPIIMMSALATEADILKGYSLKVDDYVTKPFNPKVLVAKIKNLLERINKSEITNQISGILEVEGIKMNLATYEESRKLKDILTKDDLTGISNRRYIDFYLNNKIKEAEEFNATFGILFFDIDHFKKVNDTYGHIIGDEILKMVSKTLNTNIRSEDFIGRWGGEEFIAVFNIPNISELNDIASKLKTIISKAAFKIDDSQSLSVTVSIGGTMFIQKEGITSLISRADELMYESKESGRDKITVK